MFVSRAFVLHLQCLSQAVANGLSQEKQVPQRETCSKSNLSEIRKERDRLYIELAEALTVGYATAETSLSWEMVLNSCMQYWLALALWLATLCNSKQHEQTTAKRLYSDVCWRASRAALN